MPNPAPHKVAVSYAWKEERGGDNATAVETFCEQLRTAGVTVIRDIDRLKHGECISTFMRSIGAADFLCVFLSDAYLKLPNCMYELLIAWQRSKDNPDEFRSRVKVWVMPGAEVRTTASRLAYLEHWLAEKEKVEPLIAKFATGGLAAAELETFRRIKQFAEHVNEMLCFFADTLSPQSVDEYQAWIAEQFPASLPESDPPPPKPRRDPTPEELAAVFAETVTAIESALNSAPGAAKFLGPQAPAPRRLATQQAGQWAVLPTYREKDADVSPVLQSIWERRSTFAAPRHEWDALELIVGGILVLGMNRQWVWEQRQIAATKAVEHPKYADAVNVEAGTAQFLAVIATALADGCVRLERVFGTLDPKRIPDMNPALPANEAASRVAEIKRHFIQYVLGPRDDLDVDALEGEALDANFKRVRELLILANRVDRNPFGAAGPHLTKLATEVKQHLELSDLYLFVPGASGDESQLMTNPILALSLAQRIRTFIQTQRPNI